MNGSIVKYDVIESTHPIVDAIESGLSLIVRASVKLSRNRISPLRTVIVVR